MIDFKKIGQASVFSAYYFVEDQIDARIGRRAAIAFDIMAPLFLGCAIVFSPGSIFLYALNIECAAITFSWLAVASIVYGKAVIAFQAAKNTYQKEQIKQIIQDSKPNCKKALIIETADWTGGNRLPNAIESMLFRAMGNDMLPHFRLNLLQLKKEYSIQQIVPQTERQLSEDLDDLVEDGTINFLWILGHGNSKGIHLNEGFYFDKNSPSIKALAKKLQKPALCVLSSCSTGRGNSSIAQSLSESFPNTTIYAPEHTVNIGYQVLTENLRPIFYYLGLKVLATRGFLSGKDIADAEYA